MLWSYFGTRFFESLVNRNIQNFLFWSICFLLSSLLNFFFDFTSIFLKKKFRNKLEKFLRRIIIQKVLDDSLAYELIVGESNKVTSWIFNDHKNIVENTMLLFVWVISLSQVGTMIVVLIYHNPWAALITFLFMIVYLFLTLLQNIFKTITNKITNIQEKQTSILSNYFQGYETIILSNKTEIFSKQFQQLQNIFVKKINALNFKREVTTSIVSSFLLIIQVIIVLVFAVLVKRNLVDISSVILIISYSAMGINAIAGSVLGIVKFFSNVTLLQKFHLRNYNGVNYEIQKVNSIKDIAFEGIYFHYNDASKLQDRNYIFKNLTLKIFHGAIAIVGNSGSGKSTLFFLLLKLLVPSKGKIFINNYDLLHISNKALYSQINFIPSHPSVFTATLKDNLTLWDSKIKRSKIEEVIVKINLTNIDLDKVITENELSAGEKQKIAVGRALLFPKDILLLDESLSSIDTDAKNAILQHLLNKYKILIHLSHHINQNENFYDHIIYLGEKNV